MVALATREGREVVHSSHEQCSVVERGEMAFILGSTCGEKISPNIGVLRDRVSRNALPIATRGRTWKPLLIGIGIPKRDAPRATQAADLFYAWVFTGTSRAQG